MTLITPHGPEEAERRRAANRRVGWCLAAIAVIIFVASMLLRA